MQDIRDAFHAIPSNVGIAMEQRYLVLALGADGMDPNGTGGSAKQYSIWPIMVVALNAPPWVRCSKSHAMLWLLTQGPKEPKSMEPYMEHIAAELNNLLKNGVRTWDAHKGEYFILRVSLCYLCADSRGKVTCTCIDHSIAHKLGDMHTCNPTTHCLHKGTLAAICWHGRLHGESDVQ